MLRKWLKQSNFKYQQFAALLVAGAIVYSELMINQLTNGYDGLWDSSFQNPGLWEISLGRWFWQYISRLRFGTSVDPYTSLITLALMAAGLLLVFDLWKVTNRYVILLAGLLFMSHPSICFELSYRFMSPTFGVAFFLSVLAVWCFEKVRNPVLSILAGSLCIAFSMGSYQAYICCTAVAFLTALLIKLSENGQWKDILHFSGRSIAGILLGGIEYIAILNLYLWKCDIVMSDYQGGSSYSVLNSIRSLPESMNRIYQFFAMYFKGTLYKVNRMQGKHIFTVMFVLVLVLVLVRLVRIWKKDKLKAVLFGVLFCLYPAASMAVLMIATETGLALHMACGPALFLAALPCLFFQGEDAWGRPVRIPEKCRWLLNRGFLFWMAAILYGSVCQVVIDQNTMHEGRIATESVADAIVDKLLQEDLARSDYRYVFVGTPTSCPLYSIGTNYTHANFYSLYGAWYLGVNSAKSWRGLIKNVKGLNLDMVTGSEYVALSTSKMVDDMPYFPEPGSIRLDDGIVYVKVGDAE